MIRTVKRALGAMAMQSPRTSSAFMSKGPHILYTIILYHQNRLTLAVHQPKPTATSEVYVTYVRLRTTL